MEYLTAFVHFMILFLSLCVWVCVCVCVCVGRGVESYTSQERETF
jgi:hypothetical protein